jgi:hypothetical protein
MAAGARHPRRRPRLSAPGAGPAASGRGGTSAGLRDAVLERCGALRCRPRGARGRHRGARAAPVRGPAPAAARLRRRWCGPGHERQPAQRRRLPPPTGGSRAGRRGRCRAPGRACSAPTSIGRRARPDGARTPLRRRSSLSPRPGRSGRVPPRRSAGCCR